MVSQEAVQFIVEFLVKFATSMLLPSMIVLFGLGALLRGLIYYTISREKWFAREFDRRAQKYLDENPNDNNMSFFIITKKLLEKTFYEAFVVRAIMKRRNPDIVMAMSDRVFLIQQGSAWLIRDTLKQVKFLDRKNHTPKLLEISRNVFQNNPCFNRVFGVIPVNMMNDVLNILPGIFIIGGIFGTFLGIMKALPELSGMDLNDIEGTKLVMDNFLLKISFSMSTSIIGILLSVSMTVFNTLCNPEKLFMDIVERFESTLDIIWNRCADNKLPEQIPDFDEHRDPIEALAEDSLNEELTALDKKKGIQPRGKDWQSPTLKESIKVQEDSDEDVEEDHDHVSEHEDNQIDETSSSVDEGQDDSESHDQGPPEVTSENSESEPESEGEDEGPGDKAA